MRIEGCVAIVSGAAGGIGTALVENLSRQGASRIYAAALAAPPARGQGLAGW